ncbi:sensor histidine kinase [Maricaulis sp.]|uniref:sensor histidine kinase n=1 Tax=Maricaulis sp. TaxID=1486257 RepID=UPI003A8E86A9
MKAGVRADDHGRPGGTGFVRTTPGTRLAAIILFGLGATALTMAVAQRASMDPGLPLIFWCEIGVGLGALTISGWVWALRPREMATRLFALSGLATLAFTFAAATFAGGAVEPRSLAIAMIWLNAIGASGFGLTMIWLFLVYPVRLPHWPWITAACAVSVTAFTVLSRGGYLPAWATIHLLTVIEMAAIALAIIGQLLATRRAPRDRAIAVWFGLSVLFGAGGFITLNALPQVLGMPVVIKAGYAFMFFLLIYIGVAAGLRQYRLFELGEWAFRILFYVVGSLALVALDVALVGLLSVGPGMALGLSLLAVGFLYLPLRDALARRFTSRPGLSEQEIFREVVALAFQPVQQDRPGQWQQLLTRLFDPLEIRTASDAGDQPEIREDGLELVVPSVSGIPATSLRYPWAGRSLFGAAHVRTAQHLLQLMAHADASRDAYDRGVAEERGRIARDMHDNIGAQLLGALHSRDDERKNSMIRETLTDLRDIINNASHGTPTLDETLADLRVETAERLDSVDIALDWSNSSDEAAPLPAAAAHALRSVVREAVSNAIRHSGASHIRIRIERLAGRLTLVIEDDGHGFDAAAVVAGNGLANMRGRISGLGGELSFSSLEPGSRLVAAFRAGDNQGLEA